MMGALVAGFQVVGVLPEHQRSTAPETEPLQEEAAVPRESDTAVAPAALDVLAASHTLESRKSAGFAVDFGDTASSAKGVHCPKTRWSGSLHKDMDCRQTPVLSRRLIRTCVPLMRVLMHTISTCGQAAY